jgi:imidazoleglycerol-phosphate dehydratase
MTDSSQGKRNATVERNTKETQITISVDLDGSGEAEIECPVKFLGHMLDQIARHGRFDLKVQAAGDIEVDAHHTVEDVAITLGQAFRDALGDPKGIERFGHARCPLDEALADVVVDLSGRPYSVVNSPKLPDMIGDLSAELYEHFMHSLAGSLRASVHVNIEYGRNGHHMIEASFKALARALRAATRRTGGSEVPSTKGSL